MRSTLAAVLLVAAACAGTGTSVVADGPSSTTTTTTAPRPPVDHDGPPPVEVAGVELHAWTYCYGNVCADGRPPDDPPDVGAGDELVVHFPIGGWTFEATFAEDDCGDGERLTLPRTGPTEHRLTPMGPAGTHDVMLFGRGPGGDVAVSLRWTTTVDGPFTAPAATTSIVADHDGVPDSYGVELGVTHLAQPVTDARGSVVVTSREGRTRAVELRRLAPIGCRSLRFDAPIEEGRAAAALGSPPYTYDVTLTLDGTEHRARATWPDDVDPECSPCVPLRFDPPLPARSS